MKIKRSFIIDYACCLPYGHNLHVVNLYKDREQQRGREAKAIVCKRVKKISSDELKDFDFTLPLVHLGLIIEDTKSFMVRLYIKVLRVLLLFPIGKKSNFLNYKANKSAKKLFKKYQFSKHDIIIFPSADYYGAIAFLKQISKIKVEEQPRIHFRFIGGLEHPHSFYNNTLLNLIEVINQNHNCVSLNAEVFEYANYLNSLTPNIKVGTEPYLIDPEYFLTPRTTEKKKSFTILLPGSNRAEKGYFEIFNIAKELLFEFPDIHIIVQDMKSKNVYFNKKYRSKLNRLANITLLPPVLERKELLDFYSKTDLILLPYDPHVYHFRGSGIHYEAIEHGIPVMVKKGTGFTAEVKNWNSGWVYETIPELVTYLKELKALNVTERYNMMSSALEKFKTESNETYYSSLS